MIAGPADGRRKALWRPAYVALGSNLDDPVAQVRRGLLACAAIDGTRLEAQSRLYRSKPVGPQDQPDYVNAVAALLTTLSANELLAALQAIETAQGRRRDGARWGPRTLDLDLLVYADQLIDTVDLVVPHPRIAERNFVLFPLLEIAPSLAVPGLGSVRQLASSCGNDPHSLQPLDDSTPS